MTDDNPTYRQHYKYGSGAEVFQEHYYRKGYHLIAYVITRNETSEFFDGH